VITGSRFVRSLCGVAFVFALGGVAQATEDSPQVDYMLRCQGCHVGDGSGYPGKVPDLRVSMPALLGSVEGREFLLRVPGASLSVLDNAQLARVYNWMVAEFLPGGAPTGFVPFDAAEVKRARTRPLADVQAVRIPLAAAAGIPTVY
jgi:hypothetical protein